MALRLRPHEAAALARKLERMRREIRKLRPDSTHVLRAALYETLLLLARDYETAVERRPPENATALRLRRLIERDFKEQHQPLHYARELRITPGHLNHLARRHLGRTAGAAIRERLTLEAKRRLLHRETSAAEISYELGFKDPAYFARSSAEPWDRRRRHFAARGARRLILGSHLRGLEFERSSSAVRVFAQGFVCVQRPSHH